MKHIGGTRRKARYKLTKGVRQKGKISLTKYFQSFNPGDKVLLSVEPSVQKGMYDTKYMGKSAVVKQRTGSVYEVLVKDRTKEKMLLVHPVHLRRL